MAVRINAKRIPDGDANIGSYTWEEDATPLDPGSMDGGYGQLTFTIADFPRSELLMGNEVVLEDTFKGRAVGTIRNVAADEHFVTYTAPGELAKFNVERSAPPYSGLLSGLMQEYMDLCGVQAALEFMAPDKHIDAPGFMGNVWDHIKYLMSAHQIEMSLVFDVLIVRSLRTFHANLDRGISRTRSVNSQDAARAVEINYYNHYHIDDGEVYPLSTEEPTIQQVDTGEMVEFDIQLNATLSSVNQPQHVYQTGPEDKSGTSGVYTVVGNDNLPIQPEQWRDMGGSLFIELTQDPSVVRVRIVGMNYPKLAPFRVAMSAGGTDYNSLHITGTGTAWDVRTLRLYTGADPQLITREVGAEVDNPYISTLSQAFQAGQHTAASYSGTSMTIEGSAQDINRESHGQKATVVMLRDFDDQHPGMSIADFNAQYPTETLGDLSDEFTDLFITQFQNQLFGNVAGARIRMRDAYYRINGTSVNEDSMTYTAVADTTIGDFNTLWSGKSTAEFNDVYYNSTLKEISLVPLWDGTE